MKPSCLSLPLHNEESIIMKPLVDVHMLTMDEPEEWRQTCLKSLQTAPIELHILPGIPGGLGQARVNGYTMGNLPYVSFVDPDDIYVPEVYAKLVEKLESCPKAVLAYTNEARVDQYGKVLGYRNASYDKLRHFKEPAHVHGVIVMRRSAVEKHLLNIACLPNHADWVLTLLLAQDGCMIHLPIVGRYWRQHPHQSHDKKDSLSYKVTRQLLRQMLARTSSQIYDSRCVCKMSGFK